MAVPPPPALSPACPVCIRLPFLRGPLPRGLDAAAAGMPRVPRALRLWPGHTGPLPGGGGVPEGWHEPAGYPFGPAEASACLAAFGALDARDLAGARDAADRARQERRARELGELSDLAAFAAGAETGAPVEASGAGSRVDREQAQKLLLWLWLQEERLSELAELVAGCARGLRVLAGGFGEGAQADGDAALAEAADAPGAELPLHPGLIPPWRVAAASVALFVGPETAFFAEGPMREDLLAVLDFRPAPDWGERLGCAPEDAARVRAAEAPLWRALGRPRPGGPAAVRVWLTWGRP